MGKVCILQGAYAEAFNHLQACLEIKHDLFRYKPESKEVIGVLRLIQGIKAILEQQIVEYKDRKQPHIDALVMLKGTIDSALSE